MAGNRGFDPMGAAGMAIAVLLVILVMLALAWACLFVLDQIAALV